MVGCARWKAEARCRKTIKTRGLNTGVSDCKLENEQRFLIKIFSGSDIGIYRLINVMIWAKVYTRIDLGVSGVSRTRRIVNQIADKLSHEAQQEWRI